MIRLISARKANKKVWGIFGQVDLPDGATCARRLGLGRWVSLADLAGSADEAMRQASKRVTQAAFLLAAEKLNEKF